MLLPRIQYNPGSGAMSLDFTYPPVHKPGADELVAFRTDTFSDSGIGRQSITSRIETFRTLEFAYVPVVDLDAWTAFMQYALTGGVFTYYPDRNNTELHDDWSLTDPTNTGDASTGSTDWSPAYVCRGLNSFTLRMRKEITA